MTVTLTKDNKTFFNNEPVAGDAELTRALRARRRPPRPETRASS